MLVATVVLQLVAERRMGLDDSVEKWLPGFVRGNGYDSHRITFRHLLQHTAGIARYGLGIFSRTLACGGTVWIPGGDQVGYRTRLGVTPDGHRSAVVSMSSQLHDASTFAQEGAAVKLIDHAIC